MYGHNYSLFMAVFCCSKLLKPTIGTTELHYASTIGLLIFSTLSESQLGNTLCLKLRHCIQIIAIYYLNFVQTTPFYKNGDNGR